MTSPQSSGNVLVVDDDEPTRWFHKRFLEEQGYHVREAPDGEAALEEIGRSRPDIVLLDVMMPRKGGFEVLQELKGNPDTRLLPIVLITSLDQLQSRVQAKVLGADDYLLKPFQPDELTARIQSLTSRKHFTDEMEHAPTVLEGIAMVVCRRDLYTGDHCRRVGEYATEIGRRMGLDEEALRTLRLAAILHDVGKIHVPDAILRKPGPLSPAEFEVIKTHPIVGEELCSSMKTLRNVTPLIRSHHERLDGTGYPDRLAGDRIPLPVRILSVADVYDALHTRRPYKPAFPPDKCARILREETENGWWDRDVVNELLEFVSSNGSDQKA